MSDTRWTPQDIIDAAGGGVPVSPEAAAPAASSQDILDNTLKAIQGPFTKPYVSPYENRSVQNERDILNYGVEDIHAIVGGLGAMASYPFSRIRQAALGEKSLIEPATDIPGLAKIIADTGAYYWNEHIKPIYDRALGDNPEPVYKYVIEHAEKALVPDLLTFGAPAFAGKALKPAVRGASGAIAKTAPAQKLAGAIEQTGLPEIFNQDIFPSWMRQLSPSGKVTEYYRTQLAKLDTERQSKFIKAAAELDEAARALPPNLTEAITAIAERTDPKLVAQYRHMPEVQRYLAVADKYNRAFVETFNVPLKQQFIARYGPMYLSIMRQKRLTAIAKLRQKLRDKTLTPEARAVIRARTQDLAKPLRFADLNKPVHFRRMRKLMDDLVKSGEKPPTFVPLRGKIAVGKQLGEVYEPMGGLSGRVATTARKAGLGEIDSPYDLETKDLPGILMPRRQARVQPTYYRQQLPDHNTNKLRPISPTKFTGIRKPYQSSNMNNLIKGEIAEMYKYQAIREYIATVVRSAPQNIKGKGWVTFNLLDEMTEAAGPELRSRVADGMRKQGIPPTIEVPEKVEQLLRDTIKGYSPNPRGNRLLAKAGSMWARLHYGLNPVFGPVLAGQTAMISATMPKTPQQAAAMFVAHVVALNPRAKALLPAEALLSHSDLLIHDPALLNAGNRQLALLQWLNKKTALDYRFHNYQRRATMLYLALYATSKKSATVKQMVADLTNADAALNRAVATLGDPAALAAAKKSLGDYMGRYGKADYRARRDLQDIFPTIAWPYHAANLIKTVPIEHPIKTSIATTLAHIIHDQLPETEQDWRKRAGQIPLTDRQGEQMTGVNGEPLWYGGPHMDVLGSGLEMVTGTVPSNINPLINTAFGIAFGLDMHTKKPFNNPDYQPLMHGRLLRDRQTAHVIPGDTKQTPSPPELLAQEIDPELYRLINMVLTQGKEPSKYLGKPKLYRNTTRDVNAAEEILRLFHLNASEGR